MSDVENITKGLECHHVDEMRRINCADCPYYKEDSLTCVNELLDDAIELIKIRQEQIKKKTDKIKKLNKKNKELMEWIDHQNKVISALEEELQKERWE